MRFKHIGNGLQPFVEVAVLEHHAVKLPVIHTRRYAEIAYTTAPFRAGLPVIERLPLVRQHYTAHHIDHRGPETIVYPVPGKWDEAGFH